MVTSRVSMRVLGLSCQTARSTTKSSLSSKVITTPFRRQSTVSQQYVSAIPKSFSSVCTRAVKPLAQQMRYTSTTATAPSTTAASTIPAATQSLTWNRFLEIRKVRRQINLIASVIGVGGALFLSMYIVTTQDVDVIAQKYLGLDVLITMGIVVVATSAAGWLIGPIFGNMIFNMRYRALRGSILEKEKEFFQRIAKHRVDPTRSSYQNPVPDYYGEKIGSVRDYRRWLKDQRAFNLKRAG